MSARHMCRSLTIPREDICYASWTIDAYEGVALLRTDDAAAGRVSLLFSSDYRGEAERIIDALASEGIRITRAALTFDNDLEENIYE
jgi:hypothetical protein